MAHPGGPFWAKKDAGAWSIVKGVIDEGEDPRRAAAREFTEETGWPPPPQPWYDLGEVRLKSGKLIIGWAAEADYDPAVLAPGAFTVNLRGRDVAFPEIDVVAWFPISVARGKLNPAYGEFLDRLERQVAQSG